MSELCGVELSDFGFTCQRLPHDADVDHKVSGPKGGYVQWAEGFAPGRDTVGDPATGETLFEMYKRFLS